MTDWFFLHDNLLANVLNRFSVNLRPPPQSTTVLVACWHAYHGQWLSTAGAWCALPRISRLLFRICSIFPQHCRRRAPSGSLGASLAALAWLSLLSSAEFAEQTQLSRLIKWWCCMHSSQYAIIFCFLQTLACNENKLAIFVDGLKKTLTVFQKLALNKDSNHLFLSLFYFGLIILLKP